MTQQLDLADIQGLVARGYGDLTAASYVLLEIVQPPAAGRWLADLAGDVTTGQVRPETRALNVALTPAGLTKLGLPQDVLAQFSNEFAHGMITPHRRRLLGDVDENAPEGWRWGGPQTTPVDVLLLVFAAGQEELSACYETLSAQFSAGGVREIALLQTSDLDGVEHFGFRDGVSQPFVEGLAQSGPSGQTVSAGEFVLGYQNEYSLYTARPLVDRAADPNGVLPLDASGSGRADLGRNGTYLVFRHLSQDVRRFWRFADAATRNPDGGENPAARMRLAAKMVGRWPSGAPLVLAPEEDNPSLADANTFAYYRADADGLRCPIGSHVRRANPRDALDPKPGTEESLAVNKRHRLLRRGREYGPPLSPDEVGYAAGRSEAGEPATGQSAEGTSRGAPPPRRERSRGVRSAMSATPADTARYAENTARARRQAAAAVAPAGATRGIAAAEEAAAYEEPERGLYFICLNANISRQFEFVQSSWLNNPKFDDLYDDPDPLVAPHSSGGATFTVPARPVRQRVAGLPQFVTVHGGGYFFLPGVRALRYLASLRSRS